MTGKVVVVGGGLAGCGAAIAAAKVGANVVLLERSDLLGGCARFSGHTPKRLLPIRAEMRALGCDDVFVKVFDACTIHQAVDAGYPSKGFVWGHYDVTKVAKALYDHVQTLGIEVRLQARVKDVAMRGTAIERVVLDDGLAIRGDTFVDATGGGGGLTNGEKNCVLYGTGCVMCHFRCWAFGDRVSLIGLAGVKESQGRRKDGTIGASTSGYSLIKTSIAPELRESMERDGFVVIPVPAREGAYARMQNITASGNINAGWVENVVLGDIGGFANRMGAGYTPLEELRQVPGLENVLYAEPLAGTKGNTIRYMAISPRNNALKVPGLDNVFVAGEKLNVNGTGEATVTGTIAGHNAARASVGEEPLILPSTTIVGDFIEFVNERWDTQGQSERFHFFLGSYWERIKDRSDLYTTDEAAIERRVADAGLKGVLSQRMC